MSANIKLSKAQESDLEALFTFQLDKEGQYLAAFMPEDPNNKTVYIEKWARLLSQAAVNIQTIKMDDKIVGSVTKYEMEGEAEITYWIDRQFWGMGVATSSLKKFLAIEKMRPIYGRVVFDNIGSQRVLEKCGFLKTGTDKGFANARGEEVEEYIYKLT